MNTQLRNWFIKQTVFLQVVILTAVIGVTFTGIGYSAYQAMKFDAQGSLKVASMDSSGNPIAPSAVATDAAILSRGQGSILLTDTSLFADNGANYERLQSVGGNLKVSLQPATSGGTSTCYVPATGTTNSTNCKASAGHVTTWRLVNTTATVYYLRMYNSSSAPTCSSATGWVYSLPIPGSTSGAGLVLSDANGEAYSTGIGFCITGGASSTDNSNAASGVFVLLNYK